MFFAEIFNFSKVVKFMNLDFSKQINKESYHIDLSCCTISRSEGWIIFLINF